MQKLQPAGPLLYPAPEESYAAESRYAAEPAQDLSKIPGYPGQDYPIYAEVSTGLPAVCRHEYRATRYMPP